MKSRSHIAASTTHRPTLLLAEPSAQLGATLATWLGQEFPDCLVMLASTGDDLRRMALSEHPDVVLVSLDVPDAEGFAMLRMLRTLAPATRLIALSALNAPAYQQHAAGAGAAACLATGDRALGATIASLLPGPRPIESADE